MATADPWLIASRLLYPEPHPYADDPVGYARDQLGFHAWSRQQEIMTAVRDHPRVAVRSSHGPGKTAVAAIIALWFLVTRPSSRVITTAPTWAQVEQLLWREIRSAVAQAHKHGRCQELPAPTTTRLEMSSSHFAIGLSTNEPERFQGRHAQHLLLIVDEASGVDERIFEASEGFLTAEGAHMLLLGNPTRTGGQFHRAFTSERAAWHTIHISTHDTPNYTGEQVPPQVARSLPRAGWAEEKARAWGTSSPMYQVRVLGDFPAQAENSVVSLHQVEAAQARTLETPYPARLEDVTVACDVARYGDDETVIGTRHGDQLRIRRVLTGQPVTATAGHVIEAWRALADESGAHPRIVIDDVGVGGGLTDLLREQGYNVTGYNSGRQAIEPRKYPNQRSEAWFRFAVELPRLDLDGDEQLCADLTSPLYRLDSSGRRVVEPKADTKKRLGRSPDRADMALMLLQPTVHAPAPTGDARSPAPAGAGLGDYEAPRPTGPTLTGDLLDADM